MGWQDKVENLLGTVTGSGAFGDTMTHVPKIGAEQDFKGIWSATYLEVDPAQGVQVMSSDPNVGARLSDFKAEPKKGDKIIYREKQYYIRAIEPDGEGAATFVLEEIIQR